MTDDRNLDDLIASLWESDDASILTNQAARMLEKLQAELRQANARHLAATETGMRIGRENDSLRAENARLKKKAAEDSWIIYPDRMGGQFTQEEIDRSRNGGW